MEKEQENETILQGLIASRESEVLEFKAASKDFDKRRLGEYFSALSNEANLAGCEYAWLLMGVSDNGAITGSDFCNSDDSLDKMKHFIGSETKPALGFRSIRILHQAGKRVVMFQIPAAPKGSPISWQGHYWARNGSSLAALDISKIDLIRSQDPGLDWTGAPVSGATMSDLDPAAMEAARDAYVLKNAERVSRETVMSWPDSTFVKRVGLMTGGSLSRAALLLLGKEDAAHLLAPHPAHITWSLEGEERAYEHFRPPFLLTTTQVYRKIRNIQMRIMGPDELIVREVSKYDQRTVLEALHNCIAHQDYSKNARIVVREQKDRLIFENDGTFFDGVPDDYSLGQQHPRHYRNTFLVNAMVQLNMIDSLGYGIHSMTESQARRYLPLPSYVIDDKGVSLTVFGGIVDSKYTDALIARTDLDLAEILALDRVQKNLPISPEAVKQLRHKKLIEGRKPNFRVASFVAAATDRRAEYIKYRTQNDEHSMQLVKSYLQQYKSAGRSDIEGLLRDKLGEALDEDQKSNKIGNLLTKMRRMNIIENIGTRTQSKWVLCSDSLDPE